MVDDKNDIYCFTLPKGGTIISMSLDGVIVAHPDEPLTLYKWNGETEVVQPTQLTPDAQIT